MPSDGNHRARATACRRRHARRSGLGAAQSFRLRQKTRKTPRQTQGVGFLSDFRRALSRADKLFQHHRGVRGDGVSRRYDDGQTHCHRAGRARHAQALSSSRKVRYAQFLPLRPRRRLSGIRHLPLLPQDSFWRQGKEQATAHEVQDVLSRAARKHHDCHPLRRFAHEVFPHHQAELHAVRGQGRVGRQGIRLRPRQNFRRPRLGTGSVAAPQRMVLGQRGAARWMSSGSRARATAG